jgi:hypothetical protein
MQRKLQIVHSVQDSHSVVHTGLHINASESLEVFIIFEMLMSHLRIVSLLRVGRLSLLRMGSFLMHGCQKKVGGSTQRRREKARNAWHAAPCK